MSEKMTCPACDAHTSAVWQAFAEGRPCPYCGLSAAAMGEVLSARRRGADEELTRKYTEASHRADVAEAELSRLRERLSRAKSVLDGDEDE